MDLSKVKWIAIGSVALGGMWLLTTPGTDYMFNRLKNYPAGTDKATDESNEASLSKLGGYLFQTLRLGKAEEVLQFAVDRYPAGKNVYHNTYRLVKCREKRQEYEGAVALLIALMRANAHQYDDRVPDRDTLKLRANKLIEVHNLGEMIP